MFPYLSLIYCGVKTHVWSWKNFAQNWLFIVSDLYNYITSIKKLQGEFGAQYQK